MNIRRRPGTGPAYPGSRENNIFGHKILGRMMTTYLILLSIPLLAGVITYQKTAAMLTEDLLSANRDSLEICGDVLDMELANLGHIVKRLVTDGDINTFLSTPYRLTGSPDVIKIINAAQTLHSYHIRSDLLLDVFLHSRLNNILISTHRVHTEIEKDYEAFYRFKDADFKAWKNVYLDNYYQDQFFPAVDVVFDKKSRRVIPYAQSVPFNSREYAKGSVLGFLDTERLDELIHQIVKNDSGKVYVLAPGGTILYATGSSELKFSPEEITVFLQKSLEADLTDPNGAVETTGEWLINGTFSESTGISLLSVLPSSVISRKLAYMKTIYGIIAILLIIVGVLASFLLSYFSSKPVIEISELVLARTGGQFDGNDLDFIRRNMSELIAKNDELTQYRHTQLPMTRNVFFHRLLHGEFPSEESIRPMLTYAELDFPPPPYNVAVLALEGFGNHVSGEILVERDLVRMVLEKETEALFPRRGYFASPGHDRLAWIYSEHGDEDIGAGLAALIRRMEENYGYKLIIARGRPREGLIRIEESFQEAVQTMGYLRIVGVPGRLCHFDDLPAEQDCHHYKLETESQLIIAAKNGQIDEVAAILDKVHRENFLERRLPPQRMNLLLDALTNTAMRIRDSLTDTGHLEYRFSDIDAAGSASQRFEAIQSQFLALCQDSLNLQEAKKEKIGTSIIEYIEENYPNPGLNLSMAAGHFGFKESYFYHYFLDLTGRTFSSFLESRRMEAACSMLVTGNVTIDAVAEQTGYNSAHSFRRAFKRHTNLSPSQYQKSLGTERSS